MPPDAALPVPLEPEDDLQRLLSEGESTEPLKAELRQKVEQAHAAAHAESTRAAYECHWRKFLAFCDKYGWTALPASAKTVMYYLADYGTTRKTGSLRAARSAIAYFHGQADYSDPTRHSGVKRFLDGHARLSGTPPDQKLALCAEDIRSLCGMLDAEGGDAATRDKGAILLGYAGALRASEVTGARIEHLKITHKGATLTIPRSKTDQQGQGQSVTILRTATPATCPVVAVEELLDVLRKHGILAGPLFAAMRVVGEPALRQVRVENRRLTTSAYRAMLKRRCAAIGLDPRLIGGHSLRAGHATQAAEGGADLLEIAQQGRWENLKNVLGYIRSGRRFVRNSSGKLGL